MPWSVVSNPVLDFVPFEECKTLNNVLFILQVIKNYIAIFAYSNKSWLHREAETNKLCFAKHL